MTHARRGPPADRIRIATLVFGFCGLYVALTRDLASKLENACSRVTTMLQSKIDAPDRALARPELGHYESPDEQTDRMVTKVHETLYGIIGAMVEAAIDAKLDAKVDAAIDAKLKELQAEAERRDHVRDENHSKK